MESTGNGGAVRTVSDNPGTADDSGHWIKRGRPSISATGSQKPVSQEHALEMLASAVNYLRGSGLRVIAGNATGSHGEATLVVAITGAMLAHNEFVLAKEATDAAS